MNAAAIPLLTTSDGVFEERQAQLAAMTRWVQATWGMLRAEHDLDGIGVVVAGVHAVSLDALTEVRAHALLRYEPSLSISLYPGNDEDPDGDDFLWVLGPVKRMKRSEPRVLGFFDGPRLVFEQLVSPRPGKVTGSDMVALLIDRLEAAGKDGAWLREICDLGKKRARTNANGAPRGAEVLQ